MTVQAGAAQTVLSRDPDRARTAVQEVEDAGRQALGELRHLLDVLRPDTDVERLGPRALRAGASGFVLKDIRPEELPAAVRTVAQGGALLAPSITRRLIDRFTRNLGTDTTLADRTGRLTDRERDILVAVARGLSNTEISQALFIGPATVTSHVSGILTKLDLRDRTQIVVFAYESGLVQVGEQETDS